MTSRSEADDTEGASVAVRQAAGSKGTWLGLQHAILMQMASCSSDASMDAKVLPQRLHIHKPRATFLTILFLIGFEAVLRELKEKLFPSAALLVVGVNPNFCAIINIFLDLFFLTFCLSLVGVKEIDPSNPILPD
jgi:hypothetical protein